MLVLMNHTRNVYLITSISINYSDKIFIRNQWPTDADLHYNYLTRTSVLRPAVVNLASDWLVDADTLFSLVNGGNIKVRLRLRLR